MSPPESPRRKPNSALIVREETAPDAIHSLRPIEPLSERITARPPAIPHDAKPAPVARPVPRTPTLIQSPPPPPPGPMREKQDSVEIATGGLLELVAEKNTELAAKDEMIRAAQAKAEQLRLELEAAKKVTLEPAPPPDLPTRWQWHALLYKFGGALVAILVPCGAYLAYRVETLAPRVTTTEQNVSVVKTKTNSGRDLQREILDFLTAWQTYQDCINGQQASATERGTGHKLRSLPDVTTLWFEQNKPPNRPAPLWPTWSWATVNDCGSEPHVPTLPP